MVLLPVKKRTDTSSRAFQFNLVSVAETLINLIKQSHGGWRKVEVKEDYDHKITAPA